MKKNVLIFLIFITFSACKCQIGDQTIFKFINNTDYDCMIFHCFRGISGVTEGGVYPDTTLKLIAPEDLYKILSIRGEFRDGRIEIGKELFDLLPRDTLSFFWFHADTVKKYSWEIIQNEYKILARYDLSYQDLLQLEDYVWVIPYPPTDKMKHMKIYVRNE